MALLQAARAYVLGLPLESAHSWGLNRAIFYAAAKRGFKGKGAIGAGGSGAPGGRGETQRSDVKEYYLGDEMSYMEKDSAKSRPVFTIGGEAQTEDRFRRQIGARFAGSSYQTAWREALDYVKHFDRDALLSGSRFFSDVYRPVRDEFAEKWSEASGVEEQTPRARKVKEA